MFYYNSLKNIEKNKLAKHIHTYIAKKIIYKDLQKNLNKLEQLLLNIERSCCVVERRKQFSICTLCYNLFSS